MEQDSSPNSRLMQVKVLYTFNDENQSKCLARCQQPLNIQTAHLDSSTEIGIIELRTCIQAIVSASPELVAQLGHDYTIYAYDYSEYETPLVGQGMLSWVLATASTTPNAPADKSKTMVTGRVCKNVLALFSDGIKETLEVKLRLVPVPTCLQGEYLAGMEKYRSASTVVGQANFDTAAWTTFLLANPGFGATDTAPQSPTLFAPQPQYNAFQANDSQASLQNDLSAFDPNFNTLGRAVPVEQSTDSGSRPGTPQSRSQPQKRKIPASRPSSRASARGGRRNSKQPNQIVDTSEAEDGPVRKRARVTQVDWNGSSTFGNNSESLRVTAATAASIRGNRPSATGHPTVSDLAAAEPGVRPPTPRPQAPRRPKPRSLARSVTNLAHDIITTKPALPKLADAGEQTASPESSPEKRDLSSASSPFDMPSSPPVIVEPSPTPSSPPLPALPLHDDSGFMSGHFEDEQFDADEIFVASKYKSRMEDIHSDLPQPSSDIGPAKPRFHPRSFSDPQLQPPDSNDNGIESFRNRAQSALRNSTNLEDASREISVSEPIQPEPGMVDDATPVAEDALPANSTDENGTFKAVTVGMQIDPSRHRSESCAIETTSAAGSPAALPEHRPLKGRQNSVMHEKKKQSVQEHLAKAIKTGQMPRFCKNCGEISTPTWRKAYVKVQEGSPDPPALYEEEAGMVTWEVVDKDESGTITSYRIIKKFTVNGDTGFEEIDLCNSCGVWLFKHRCMRPPEAWNKQDGPKPPPKPRRRPSKKKPDSESKFNEVQREAKNETSDIGEPDEGGCADSEELSREDSAGSDLATSFKKPRSERASSIGILDKTKKAAPAFSNNNAKAALQRAIQSSPPRFPGSQFAPIELDKASDTSPKSTRRLLFPSPRKPGEVKSLEDATKSASRGKPARASDDKDKENQEPAECDSDEELDRHFESKNRQLAETTTTPKVSFDIDDPLKTPSKAGSSTAKLRGALSSITKRWQQSNPSTPSKGADNTLGLELEQMTPFTRQLTQLISEANQSSDGLDPSFGGDGGMFAFSDFSTDDLGVGGDFGATDPNAASAILSMFENQLASTDGTWNDDEDMQQTIDTFLQTNPVSQDDANEAVEVAQDQ